MTSLATPSQTVGPYLSIGLHWDDGPYAVDPARAGAVWLRGRVLDGSGEAIPDALVETWQAAPDGSFARGLRDEPLRGFGRSETLDGEYGVCLLKPGRVPDAAGRMQAPHLAVSVFARGLLNRVVTRVYFADEEEANASDPVLVALRDDALRSTLLARPAEDGYRLDIILQGSGETVFFLV